MVRRIRRTALLIIVARRWLFSRLIREEHSRRIWILTSGEVAWSSAYVRPASVRPTILIGVRAVESFRRNAVSRSAKIASRRADRPPG